MTDTNQATVTEVVEPRFRGRIGPAVGTLTERLNTLTTDLERIIKQAQELRDAIRELRSAI